MCGWGPYAREASVWEACCRYSGVIHTFLNCPQQQKHTQADMSISVRRRPHFSRSRLVRAPRARCDPPRHRFDPRFLLPTVDLLSPCPPCHLAPCLRRLSSVPCPALLLSLRGCSKHLVHSLCSNYGLPPTATAAITLSIIAISSFTRGAH